MQIGFSVGQQMGPFFESSGTINFINTFTISSNSYAFFENVEICNLQSGSGPTLKWFLNPIVKSFEAK